MPQEKFIEYLQYEKRYSAHTINSYQTDLRQFLDYTLEHYDTNDVNDIDHQLVRSWTVHLMEKGLSTRSINRKISTLKTWFKFLKREGLVQHNPMQKVIAPKVSKRLPVFVEESKMEMLFNTVEFEDGFVGLRDKLILELFYATGIRLSELINLETINVDFYKSTIKVLGKRNKERIIPVSNHIVDLIKTYIHLKSKDLNEYNEEFLLVTNAGKKLYPKFVYQLVNNYLSKVTTISKKSPHVLRHTFATHMLNNGADLNSIKEILGHANLSATQVYTHNTIEKLKNIHKQAHPKG